MTTHQNFFISAESLSRKLDEKSDSLKIVDGSWYLPAMGRDGRAEFDAGRIPGAQYFDINKIADTSTELPHMLPSPERFAQAAGKMGIRETDEIVVYDGPGVFSSARVWWTFKVMGAANVKILTGGIDGWKQTGFEVESASIGEPEPVDFKTDFDPGKVRDLDYIQMNTKRGNTLVLDARPFGRFTGEQPEPRKGVRSGHIPGSRSLPASGLIHNGALLQSDELVQAFEDVGLRQDLHVTTTCGSGVTAAILSLALETIGHTNHSLYDGSWADWGANTDVPVAQWK